MKGKRLFIVLLLLFCYTMTFAEQYSVTVEKLNVRQKASSKSVILFKLSKGDIVESNGHGKWMEIEYNGQKGFVYSKYLKKTDPDSSSPQKDNKGKWIIIIMPIMTILVLVIVFIWLNKYFKLSSLFYATLGSLIVIAVVPPLTKFIFGFFDLETAGKYVGWGITTLLVYGTFAESTRKAERKSSNTNRTTNDYADYPPSYLDSEDNHYSSIKNQDNYNEDNEHYYDQDDDYDNYEREKEEREEAEKRRDKYDYYMREAEEAYRQYDYYKSKADDAISSAETYIRSAESHEGYGQDYDDEGHFREAQSDRNTAEGYYREARQFMNQAKSYYNDYERAKRDAESYR